MSQYDYIQEIETVEKFNPFHDHLGRFTSARGFKTYSANPKSKAGAMAIQRSYQGGHKRTMNVHRESKGENIGQNYDWMTGKKPATKTPERKRPEKQTEKPTTETPKTPKTITNEHGHKMAVGADLTKDVMDSPGPLRLDDIAKVQGFKQKGRVIKDQKEFAAAVKETGVVMYRTVREDTDKTTKKWTEADEFLDRLKYGENFDHNGNGGKVSGGGLYLASTSRPKPGKMPSTKDQNNAMMDSIGYGDSDGTSRTILATLDPTAKVANYGDMYKEFGKLNKEERAKYDNDLGAYVASKGYDAMRRKDGGWGCDYTMVYNRSKMIFFDTNFKNEPLSAQFTGDNGIPFLSDKFI